MPEQRRAIAALLARLRVEQYPTYAYERNLALLNEITSEARPIVEASFPKVLEQFDSCTVDQIPTFSNRPTSQDGYRLDRTLWNLNRLLTTLAEPPPRRAQAGDHPPRVSRENPPEVKRLREAIPEEMWKIKGNYVGESLPLLRVLHRITILNRMSSESVLVLGEIGTGKSRIARLIHDWSPRRKRPFLEEQVTDSMHGDFALSKSRWVGVGSDSGLAGTGNKRTTGLLQEAQGGTIFVDEIHRTSATFQTFLLGVLDRRPIPVTAGKGKPVVPDVRLIFAMNVTVAEAVRGRMLQEDFLSRIQHRAIVIPPLRERKDDILLFVKSKLPASMAGRRLFLALLLHDWPHNVRELLDVLGNLGAFCGSSSPTMRDAEEAGLPTALQVSRMTDEEVDNRLYRLLGRIFGSQGLTRGKGLHRRLADFLGVSESTVSRMVPAAEGE